MKLCSASSASASEATTTHSTCPVRAIISAWPGLLGTCALEKCEATRLRTDFALPTYSTRAAAVAEEVHAGLVGQRAPLLDEARPDRSCCVAASFADMADRG